MGCDLCSYFVLLALHTEEQRHGALLGCTEEILYQGTRSTGTELGFPTLSILPPVKDGPDAGAVRAVAVHVQPGGQQDPILHSYGAVGEGGDEELVPPCRENNSKVVGQSHASSQ